MSSCQGQGRTRSRRDGTSASGPTRRISNQPYTTARPYQPHESLFDRESVINTISNGSDSDLESSPEDLMSAETPYSFASTPIDRPSGSHSSFPGGCTPTSSALYQNANTPTGRPNRSSYTFPGNSRPDRVSTFHESPQVISMLQQQQKMLQEVLQTQKLMEQKQNTFEQKLHVIEEQVVEMKSSDRESTTMNRLKCRVPKDLSVSSISYSPAPLIVMMLQKKVAAVHDAVDEGFRAYERYNARP